jgi:2-oxoisovalerate dehydrogenase E2 component (dihydrolipoyl transacylase)
MNRFPVTLPDLGAAGQSIRVSAWFVDVGDRVVPGESVAEVLVPGITRDVPTTVAGRVVQIVTEVDRVVAPGDVLAWIEPVSDVDAAEI